MIRNSKSFLLALLLTLAFSCAAGWSQQPAGDPKDKDKDSSNDPAPPPGGMQMQVTGGPGRMMVRMGGPGGPGGMFGNDELNPLILTLGELNLSPAFKLSDDQKTKIQSIRDDFKNVSDAWRKDHADDLKQLDDKQKEVFDNMQNGGGPDPGEMMELMQQRNELMQTAPSGEEHAKQVRAALTPDQLKALEAKEAEQEKDREEMMKHMPMRFGPGGPGGAGGPPPAADDHDKADQKDKDKKDDKGK